MRVYKRHGGRFFRASFSLITQRYHPRAWLNQLICFIPRPQIFREYFAVFVGFSVFLTKGRERVIRSEKKFCETPAVQRSCYLFFGEFLMNLLARLLSQLFLPQTLWFFFRRGCVGGVNFFVFLFAQRLLETRLFLFSPKRGKTIRRWHWEPQLLAHLVAEKKNIITNIHWISSFQTL